MKELFGIQHVGYLLAAALHQCHSVGPTEGWFHARNKVSTFVFTAPVHGWSEKTLALGITLET